MSSEHEDPGVTTTSDPASVVPALAVAAVARRLGVAPATLRTWDRRYGLGPSEHAAGEHRRYSALDVERLLVMRRLTLDGVAPGDAARAALAADLWAGDLLTAAAPELPQQTDQTWPVGQPAVTPTDLVDGALAGDVDRCTDLLRRTLSDRDVPAWWTGLVEPALADLARRTVVDPPGVDAEHTLSSAALAALRDGAARRSGTGADVVLVLVPTGEPRPLEAHALAAALTGHGVDARIVGGPVGAHHAVELVAMTRAVAVVTVGRREDPDLSVVAWLAGQRPDVPQFVRLPSAAQAGVPVARSVHLARSFAGVLHEVLAVARPAVPHTDAGTASSDEPA